MNTKLITILTLSSLTASSLSAGILTFTPDTLAEFQTSGDVIFKNTQNDGSGSSTEPSNPTSTISDPTVEVPNEFRFTTELDVADRALYRHNLIGATVDMSTQGEILGIDFTIEVSDPGLFDDDTWLHFGLVQDGNTFFYTEETGTAAQMFRFRDDDNNPDYLDFDLNGLTASSFALVGNHLVDADQTSNPDFSATGSSIQFVLGSLSATGSTTFDRATDFRNAQIDVTVVPEPSSLMLLGGAMMGILMLRRYKA